MSLDVYLEGETTKVKCVCSCCQNEHERETTESHYSGNVTHNLTSMADAAGIYKHLWRPEEVDVRKAGQLIEPLRKGLHLLRSDPGRFRQHNPPNGWGDYDGFVRFVSDYLSACMEHPMATVRVWR